MRNILKYTLIIFIYTHIHTNYHKNNRIYYYIFGNKNISYFLIYYILKKS
jgi:hypothetical protein